MYSKILSELPKSGLLDWDWGNFGMKYILEIMDINFNVLRWGNSEIFIWDDSNFSNISKE